MVVPAKLVVLEFVCEMFPKLKLQNVSLPSNFAEQFPPSRRRLSAVNYVTSAGIVKHRLKKSNADAPFSKSAIASADLSIRK